MIGHEHETSEAEEMYLITVARAIEDGDGPPVSVTTLARELDVTSVSANQMVKKLETLGLVEYTPYKGVDLTSDGERLAGSVLRSRRLWGVFLVEHLGLSPRRADEVACEMEHVTPTEVADRLSEFLGDPTRGPQGREIPSGEASVRAATEALSDVGVGDQVRIVSAQPQVQRFLEANGIATGDTIRVQALAPDASVLIEADESTIHLSVELARDIAVNR